LTAKRLETRMMRDEKVVARAAPLIPEIGMK